VRGILLVGGNHPDLSEFRGRSRSESLPDLRNAAGRRSKVFLMVGAQSPEDLPAAEATAALVGAAILAVSDMDGAVRHGALFPLAQQRRLPHLLEALLSADTSSLALTVPSIRITKLTA
jgi:hypothetical protein